MLHALTCCLLPYPEDKLEKRELHRGSGVSHAVVRPLLDATTQKLFGEVRELHPVRWAPPARRVVLLSHLVHWFDSLVHSLVQFIGPLFLFVRSTQETRLTVTYACSAPTVRGVVGERFENA